MDKITPSQQKAIEYNEGAVTLSAAAGSGKTFVLTNRIVDKISKGTDVSSLLVVTFTVDAAKEIKTRVADEIGRQLAKDPYNKRLNEQSLKVQKADICTIDSFCQKLLRRNFDKAGISPDFKIIDDVSYKLLQKSVAAETVEEIAGIDEFKPLFMNFLSADDTLEKSIIGSYNHFMNKPSAADLFKQIEGLYDAPLYESVWFETVVKNIYSFLIYIKDCYDRFIADVSGYPEINEALKRVYLNECNIIDRSIEAIHSKNYKELTSLILNFKFDRFDVVPKAIRSDLFAKHLDEIRNELKDTLFKNDSKFRKYLFLEEEDYLKVNKTLKTNVNLLFKATALFEEKLLLALEQINSLYYGEIQKKCFDLLVSDYDINNDVITPSEIAVEISNQYSEILIDEYQDTNLVQDVIFRAISKKESNIFTVGDEKQCIYSFRDADPNVFKNRIRSDKNENIMLSHNFRSRAEVIDYINLIFNNAMRPDTGFSDYENNDRLILGSKDYTEGKGCSKCVLIDVPDNEELFSEIVLSDDGDKTAQICEAVYIATEIKRLISEETQIFDKKLKQMRKIRLSDIVILLRANTNKSTFAKVLANYGISVFNDNGAEFYKKYEISVILALLEVINNFKDDISTAAVMRSPLFCFTDSELASLIVDTKSEHLYQAVLSAYSNNAKIKNFVDTVRHFKVISDSVPVHTLLNYIYNDLNVEALFLSTENGKSKVNNLINLISTAEHFENNSVGGLYSFLEYVKEQLEDGNTKKEVNSLDEGDFVRIVTIHGSKGLEYPVCFIGELFHTFNCLDARKPIKFNDDLGVCMKIMQDGVRRETLQNSVYNIVLDEKNATEELRLLYVAMTRARERLYMVGATKNLTSAVRKAVALSKYSSKTSAWSISNAKCYANWLLPSSLRYTNSNKLREALDIEFSDVSSDIDFEVELFDAEQATAAKKDAPMLEYGNSALIDILQNGIQDTEIAITVPEKISVSAIKSLKGNNSSHDSYSFTSKPRFKTNKIDARDRGNAIHKFLRYADWKKILAEGSEAVNEEAKKLISKNVFSSSEKEALNYDLISGFFKNSFTEKLLTIGDVIHEKKFTLNFNADDVLFEESDDKITVQGIIDLFAVSDDGIYLIDFKTDRLSPDSDGRELIEKYHIQLDVYEKALSRMYAKPVLKKYIYSFALNKYIECP